METKSSRPCGVSASSTGELTLFVITTHRFTFYLQVSTALGYYYSFLYGTLAISKHQDCCDLVEFKIFIPFSQGVNVKLSSPGCIIDNRGSLTQGLIIILVAETCERRAASNQN